MFIGDFLLLGIVKINKKLMKSRLLKCIPSDDYNLTTSTIKFSPTPKVNAGLNELF